MDKEKVIKGLEICSEYGSWHGLCCEDNEAYKDCPYHGCETGCIVTIAKDALALLKEQEIAYQGAEELLRQKMILFEDAIKRLKKQEAIEPVKQIEQTEWTVCGNCHNHIISKWMFCPYCGRPIKWE